MSALKSIPTPDPGSEVKSTAEVGPSAAEVAREVRRQRARRLVRRLSLWVALPTLLSCVYYYGLARDQYVSFATLIVRGNGAPGSAVMLREYLQSRDLLATLEQRENFSQHYIDQGDAVFGLSARAGSETRYDAFRRAVSVRHDASSGVVQLAVKAFSPRAAHDFARVMVEEGGRFMWSLDEPGSARISEIARPSRPSESSYPHRGYGVLTALCVSLALFVIGSLLIMAVREHAQF